MKILKAYADAGAMSQQGYGALRAPRASQGQSGHGPPAKGEFLTVSEEARQLFAQSGAGGISVMPQDATYDQHGHVMRQLDSLQGDLRQLAAQFMLQPGGEAMAGRLGAMRSRLSSIRAQV